MHTKPLSRSLTSNAKKSPCSSCGVQNVLEYLEESKPEGWHLLQFKMREKRCPCEDTIKYADGIEGDWHEETESTWQDALDEMETYFDIYDDFIRALGFSSPREVAFMCDAEIEAHLRARDGNNRFIISRGINEI